jgi:hypothetical protein
MPTLKNRFRLTGIFFKGGAQAAGMFSNAKVLKEAVAIKR